MDNPLTMSMETNILFSCFAFFLGAIVGSFLNVVILRLPSDDQSILFPASHCPSCKNSLAWYENIPILSYIFLKGRCSHCQTKISMQYPVVELLMAILSLALYHHFGLSLTTGGYFFFCAALLSIIWIDIHHQIIPDKISIPGIAAGFFFSFVNVFVSWQESLIGIALGGGVLFAISALYYLLRKQEGMGGGDIKLLAMLGAFLGYKSLPFIIFASSLSGAIVGLAAMIKQKKGGASRIPFGPFLSLAALFYLFFRDNIHRLFLLYINGELF